MTADQLKALFSTPLMLLALMIVAALGSALKQLAVARRQGTPMTVMDYFFKIETVITVGSIAAAWLGLLFSDSLNIASALGLGYVANDTADAWTKSGRSQAIAAPVADAGSTNKPTEVK